MQRALLALLWTAAAALGLIAVLQIVSRPDAPSGPALRDIDFPTWSPDGNTIAFSAVTDEGYDLWTVRVDGSAEPQRLTTSMVDEVAPAWGTTGRIAYAADPAAALTRWMQAPSGSAPHASIQTILEDGSDPIQLTHHEEAGTIPTWITADRVSFACPDGETPATCEIGTDFEGFTVVGDAPDLAARRSIASPDGTRTAVILGEDDGKSPGLYLVTDGEPEPLVTSD